MDFKLFPTLRALNLPAPKGVIQVGASYGQEMREFLDNGIEAGVFVEPLPQPFAHLAGLCRQLPNFVAVNALVTDEPGQRVQFHVASNGGMSSSILAPDRHLAVNPGVRFEQTVELTTATLDGVCAFVRAQGHGAVVDRADLLYMDCQGAEYRILLGAPGVLRRVKVIFTETMRGRLYAGQVPLATYGAHLEAMGFTLNTLHFDHPADAGNALFVRRDVLGLPD